MDYRDTANHYRPVLDNVNTRTMTATFTAEGPDGDETEYDVQLKFEVCDTCNGRGRYVNPSIDSHGLTREDFSEDPDFTEGYFSGRYDVTCASCKGERVMPVVDTDVTPADVVALYEQREQDAWDDARETANERKWGY